MSSQPMNRRITISTDELAQEVKQHLQRLKAHGVLTASTDKPAQDAAQPQAETQPAPNPMTFTGEMRALVDNNLTNRIEYVGRRARVDFRRDSSATYLKTGIPYPSVFLNLVYNLHTDLQTIDSEISDTLDHMEAQEHPLFWSVNPKIHPREMGKHLEAHNMEWLEDVWSMVLEMKDFRPIYTQPEGLVIERVNNVQRLKQFVNILTNSNPPSSSVMEAWMSYETALGFDEKASWQRFVGYYNGKPVASAALFMTPESAGVYHVETLPETRGKGIGSYITQYVVELARKRCFRWVTLIATPMGYNIYRRLGFQSYNSLQVYGVR